MLNPQRMRLLLIVLLEYVDFSDCVSDDYCFLYIFFDNVCYGMAHGSSFLYVEMLKNLLLFNLMNNTKNIWSQMEILSF